MNGRFLLTKKKWALLCLIAVVAVDVVYLSMRKQQYDAPNAALFSALYALMEEQQNTRPFQPGDIGQFSVAASAGRAELEGNVSRTRSTSPDGGQPEAIKERVNLLFLQSELARARIKDSVPVRNSTSEGCQILEISLDGNFKEREFFTVNCGFSPTVRMKALELRVLDSSCLNYNYPGIHMFHMTTARKMNKSSDRSNDYFAVPVSVLNLFFVYRKSVRAGLDCELDGNEFARFLPVSFNNFIGLAPSYCVFSERALRLVVGREQ